MRDWLFSVTFQPSDVERINRPNVAFKKQT